ncbi:MAG: MBL fold metallo-hydrolase [Chloroflexi bacterium]|nr:MBL fold metallo-hydrolase [Chloroflexota bacterium]
MLPALGAQVFLLAGETLALVDTGWRGSPRLILAGLGRAGYRPQDVDLIVLTHYHPDHSGSVAALRAATGARVAVHGSEAALVAGVAPYPNLFRRPVMGQLMAPFTAWTRPPPAPVDLLLEEGDGLPGLPGWQVLHTPGHTPGSICLWHPDEGTLIVGDVMECRGGRPGLPSRAFTVDMPQAKASIRRLAGLHIGVVLFSHFRPLRNHAQDLVRGLAASFAG